MPDGTDAELRMITNEDCDQATAVNAEVMVAVSGQHSCLVLSVVTTGLSFALLE
jgi:hypothetical protein